MKKPANNCCVSLLAVMLAVCQCWAGNLTEQQINRLKRSVIKVYANNRIGTGFIFSDRKYAVTAYHVIAGSNGNVSVGYTALSQQRVAGRVIKTLKRADLALIEIDNPRNVNPLQVSAQVPAFNASFTAIGYLWDANDTWARNIVKNQNKDLESFLPASAKNDVRTAQCPSLSLNIITFEGNPLVPGYSGAPIFHDDEGIIAIGDGGIREGLASVSWGIPASQLNLLMASTEYTVGGNIHTQTHFNADMIENPQWASEVIQISGRSFSKTRTETLPNIMNATDDINGLNQIMATFPPQIDRAGLTFDVYQDFQSGATFILPAGFRTTVENQKLKVFAPGRKMVATIQVSELASNAAGNFTLSPEVQNVSNTLEYQALMAEQAVGWTWIPNPSFSYLMPVFRPDGFAVRRKSFLEMRQAYNQFNQLYYEYDNYFFESFIAKGKLLIHFYTTNRLYSTRFMQNVMYCSQSGFAGATCAEILNDSKNFLSMVIATHFATFNFN